MSCTICLFSADLRVADNSCLTAACRTGLPVLPVYIHDEGGGSRRRPGARSRWWLHHSLHELDRELASRGSRLILRQGSIAGEVARLISECRPASLHAMRDRPDPGADADAKRLQSACAKGGVELVMHDNLLMFAPGSVRKPDGSPYRVFTPFWRRCLSGPAPERPAAAPASIAGMKKWPPSARLEQLGLDRDGSCAQLHQHWQPGAKHGFARLRKYLQYRAAGYGESRDRPDLPHSTTGISPHLCFGEIGPRQLWHSLNPDGDGPPRAPELLRQLIWREFCAHLLHSFPQLPERELNPDYAGFGWRRDDRKNLAAWQRGETGFPIVDAGMRELRATGWMHNRVRMIVASLLTKNLLIDWRLGERWFWNMLVDADAANNAANWQWVAGCGADAAPFFRIFNPVLQGRKFDPDGSYVRRHVPELSGLAAGSIHAPWLCGDEELAAAGIRMGRDYPHPIVELAGSRARALAAYQKLRKRTGGRRPA